jgi:hypothetical protein
VCYLIIGVFGPSDSGGVAASFSLVLTITDSIVTLSEGVPVRGSVDKFDYAYYKYTLTTPSTDVVISVTPFSGDPDMFVSVSPLRHPTTSNYTWLTVSKLTINLRQY